MTVIQRFSKNPHGRDLIVGDIHGAFTKLNQALKAIDFQGGKDRLFAVGDLVDRGPESHHYRAWLDLPWFYPVRGNHEEMAIQYARGLLDEEMYRANGGLWNITNCYHDQKVVANDFKELPLVIELETEHGLVGIVHADVPTRTWQEFTRLLQGTRQHEVAEYALWSRERIKNQDDAGVHGIRVVIVGHTPLRKMTVLGNVIHIDTGGWIGVAGGSHEFTILDAASLEPVIGLRKAG